MPFVAFEARRLGAQTKSNCAAQDAGSVRRLFAVPRGGQAATQEHTSHTIDRLVRNSPTPKKIKK